MTLLPTVAVNCIRLTSIESTTDYLELRDVSKALAAAAPVTALTFSSAGGITTGSRRYADVSGVSPVGFVPGPKFRPVPAERTMINFVSFDEHTLEIDVFNPPRK